MLTAKQVKQLTFKSVKAMMTPPEAHNLLANINDFIRYAALQAKMTTDFHITERDAELIDPIVYILRYNGYEVSVETKCHQGIFGKHYNETMLHISWMISDKKSR